ncbi:hypothetical protein ABZ915_47760 [Streptomyces sp. NPDC046915]|uniref:hypothetical protein n=1 Tax=Streptomyces sp. NPDC046915 TaxID=3155257 RepID=UPI00340E6E7B
MGNANRAAILNDRPITDLSADVIAELMSEAGPLWQEQHQARLASRPRKRAVGAGATHLLVSVDQLLATLVHPARDPVPPKLLLDNAGVWCAPAMVALANV